VLVREDFWKPLLEGSSSLGDRDPAIEQDRPQLVNQSRTPADQPLPGTMDRLKVQLRLALYRHEAHARALHRLGIGLGIPGGGHPASDVARGVRLPLVGQGGNSVKEKTKDQPGFHRGEKEVPAGLRCERPSSGRA
jgi:hypothetical protein